MTGRRRVALLRLSAGMVSRTDPCRAVQVGLLSSSDDGDGERVVTGSEGGLMVSVTNRRLISGWKNGWKNTML